MSDQRSDLRGKVYPPLNEARVEAFLTTLSEIGSVSEACRRHCICRTTIYARRDEDETLAAAWEQAKALAVEALEDEAHRRAVVGIKKTIYYQGEKCGTERVYSDHLLTLLLRGNNEKYRDKRDLNVTGDITLAQRLERARDRTS